LAPKKGVPVPDTLGGVDDGSGRVHLVVVERVSPLVRRLVNHARVVSDEAVQSLAPKVYSYEVKEGLADEDLVRRERQTGNDDNVVIVKKRKKGRRIVVKKRKLKRPLKVVKRRRKVKVKVASKEEEKEDEVASFPLPSPIDIPQPVIVPAVASIPSLPPPPPRTASPPPPPPPARPLIPAAPAAIKVQEARRQHHSSLAPIVSHVEELSQQQDRKYRYE